MTQVIIDDVIPRTQLLSAAGQTVFNTNWTADVATDVLVYARAAGIAPNDATQLVSSSNYNVTFIGGSATVRVTFLVARTLDDVITIVRDTPAERLNLYINTNFTPSMLNEDFGILTLVDQQAQMYDYVVNPGYNVSATIENIVDTVLPILAANQIWAMNSTRTGIIAYNVPSGGGVAPSDAKYLLQTASSELPNAQAMGALASGLVVNTTATGVQLTRSIAGTVTQIGVANGSGIGGNPTIYILPNPIMGGTEGMGIPQGTTAQRPGSPVGTEFRFNTSLIILEYWDGSSWVQISETDGVVTAQGTEHQVLVNGTFGSPVDGAIILTTPQDIDTSSSPTFAAVNTTILNTPTVHLLGSTSGSINLIATPIAGSNVITFPAATGTVALTSGASGHVTSGTINQLAWYAATGDTVSGLATANSGTLITSAAGVPSILGPFTNGQLLIGSTGASPVIANLSAGPGISINNTAGGITISGTGSGTGFTLVTGTTQAMVADAGYVPNNVALCTLTLPTTAAFGTSQTVVGLGAGGWRIAQNALQNIQVGNQTTTIGVGGSLSSSNRYDSIDLLCVVANTTWVAWGAPQSAGLTFV